MMALKAAPGVRTGLVGDGIQGSRSPAIHEREAAAQGLDLSYVRFDLADPNTPARTLAEVLDSAERDGFSGLNVTYPYKLAVIPLLDQLSPDAERLGAVNTVVFDGGRRIGYNTDWLGFQESFQRGLPEAPRDQVLQLGAGGAGAAVAYALLGAGAGRLSVYDVDKPRAAELAAKMGRLFGPQRVTVTTDVVTEIAAVQGLVNSTPIGMLRHPGSPVPTSLLRPEMWVADIVYVPIETELLRAARALGCRALDGGGMVVYQAAEAFRLFTRKTADADRMRSRFIEAINQEDEEAVSTVD